MSIGLTIGDLVEDKLPFELQNPYCAWVDSGKPKKYLEFLKEFESLRPQKDYCVYVISHEDTVLYVGRSQNCLTRVLRHIGVVDSWGKPYPENIDWLPGSSIGQLIADRRPNSLKWKVTLYDCDEIAELAGNETGFGIAAWKEHIGLNPERAEEFMILHLRPCLNVAGNPQPAKLPKAYIRRTGRGAQRAARAAFDVSV